VSGGSALRRLAVQAAVVGASSAVAAGLAAAAAATVFARRVVTPEGERAEDVEVLGVAGDLVTLRADVETSLQPGRYGLWQSRRSVHARLGPVIDHDPVAGTVQRRVLQHDAGRLRPGRALFNPYFFAGTPRSALGLAHEDVVIPGETGDLHGWVVPAGPPGGTWAILVHGRAATREECLRALPVLHRLGITALVAGYRSTAGLPVPPLRYHLGDTEWLDVEAAILHALAQGAEEIVLFGWSMGGAMVMQTASRSWTADRVKGIVLDCPVLDWRDVLAHQARVNRLPTAVGKLGRSMLSHRAGWRLAGTEAPLDLDRLDWVTRADELAHPVLLFHSDDDLFVPSGPSRKFAEARPDLVTFLAVEGAGHCREWNVDPNRWDSAVARFLLSL
jgi:uncharacterized protein